MVSLLFIAGTTAAAAVTLVLPAAAQGDTYITDRWDSSAEVNGGVIDYTQRSGTTRATILESFSCNVSGAASTFSLYKENENGGYSLFSGDTLADGKYRLTVDLESGSYYSGDYDPNTSVTEYYVGFNPGFEFQYRFKNYPAAHINDWHVTATLANFEVGSAVYDPDTKYVMLQ